MPFSDDWVVRDCPWCGLRDAQMRHLSMNLEADPQASTPRFWSVVSCPGCGGAVLLEHTPPNDPQTELLNVAPEHAARVRIENVPVAVRRYYEDAIRVLEAVGARASDVDEKTARRALQYATQVLRTLFGIPAEPAPPSAPERKPE